MRSFSEEVHSSSGFCVCSDDILLHLCRVLSSSQLEFDSLKMAQVVLCVLYVKKWIQLPEFVFVRTSSFSIFAESDVEVIDQMYHSSGLKL